MADPRTARIRELFIAAADLDGPAREAFLDDRCGDDPSLCAEVHDLLEHEARVDADFLGGVEPRVPDLVQPGTVVDTYTIDRQLGEGAFGVVYLAHQARPVQRDVALKVVKPGMDTREVVRRFAAERQVLALMHHANIAKVFDAGSTPEGRPYFVMEYVEGTAIDDYCDDNRLTVEQRLDLFATVCDAVQHAHQRGVIHRDIKPSNILIETVDGVAEAKIIDFGIAKAMRGGVLDTDAATTAGQLLGTPDYMSPEQAGIGSGVIASTTDIYSLGVVLYELVTGMLPFDPRELRREGVGEIQRIIREVDPPKPSTRLGHVGSSGGESEEESFAGAGSSALLIAKRRRTDPRALRRSIHGELDWITMRAMEKDPARRYASASELAADVRRHLGHQPVAAGPPGAAYLVRKFVRRNRGLCTAALVCGLALAAGMTGVLVQSARVAREAEAARLVNAFYNSMLAAVDPMQFRLVSGFTSRGAIAIPEAPAAFGRDLPVAEMLALAAPGIDDAFNGKPDLEADVRETFGVVFLSLGRHDDAQSQLRAALEIRRALLPDADVDLLRSKLLLGYAIWDARCGDYREAEALVRQAIDGLRGLHGDDHADTLNARRILADVLAYDGNFAEANDLYADVYRRQRVRGPRDLDTLATMHSWSVACLWQGWHIMGERLAQEVLDIATEHLGSDHMITLRAQHLLGSFLSQRGDLGQAIRLHRAAYENCGKALGPDHPMTYYMTRAYATSSIGMMPMDETEALFERAYTGQLATVGPDHRERFFAAGAYAAFIRSRGRAEEAVDELLVPALEMFVHTRRPDHAVSVTAFRTVAGAQGALGRDAEARAMALRGLDAARRLAKRPDVTPFDLYIAAGFLRNCPVEDLQDLEGARVMLERAIAMADEEQLGERWGVITAYLHVAMIQCCQRLGDDECVRIRRLERLPLVLANSRDPGMIEDAAWRIAKDPAFTDDAYELAMRAVDGLQALPVHPWYLRTLGAAQYRLGDLDAALDSLSRYAEVSTKPSPQALAMLAMAHDALGNDEDAQRVMSRLYTLPEEVPRTSLADHEAAIAEAEAALGR